jgi:alanyl-tRNA synthetase
MGDAYPELVADQSRVEESLQLEGERFADTLEHGIRILDQEIDGLSGSVLAGDVAFRLYDTYGFPVDLTADYCREKGLTVDMSAGSCGQPVPDDRDDRGQCRAEHDLFGL